MRRLRWLGATFVLAAMTACTTGGDSPAPTPNTPTVPVASASPSPSSNPSQDALIEEAIAVYKRSFEARWKQFKAGGLAPDAPIPASFSSTMKGVALDRAVNEQKQTFLQGIEVVSGQPELRGVQPVPDMTQTASSVTLEACIDGRSIENRHTDGSSSAGLVNRARVFLSRDSGTMMVTEFQQEEVDSCALN